MITRGEHRLPALGYVTRYGAIVEALGRVCERLGIAALRPARVSGSDEAGDSVTLHLESEGQSPRVLRAAVVVQAEGGLFGEQADKAETRDYRQTAIIAQVNTSAPVAHRAYERFTSEGPLALLYVLLSKGRKDGMMALESEIDDPHNSALFAPDRKSVV